MSTTRLLRGKEVTLYIMDALLSDWKPLGCATGLSMEKTVDTIEITTVDSERQREYVPGMEQVTGTFEGVITLDENPITQYDELMDLMGAKQLFMIRFENEAGAVLFYQIPVIITKVSATAPATDFTGFNLDWIRTGNWSKLKIIGDILVDSDGDPILDSGGNYIKG